MRWTRWRGTHWFIFSQPWSKGGVEPPQFLAKDEKLPLTLSLVMGLQHALAMVAGIATSGGMLIAGDALCGNQPVCRR